MDNIVLADVTPFPQHAEMLPNGYLRVPVLERWYETFVNGDGTAGYKYNELKASRDFGPEYPTYAIWLRLLNEKSEDIDLFDGFGNGSLHFMVGLYRYIELDFHYFDWRALFTDTLGCSEGEPCQEGEDSNECHERNRRQFQAAIPQHPLLARIFDMYEDAKYSREEVPQLYSECEQIRRQTTNPCGIRAVRKLLFACREAIQENGRLVLECD